MDAIKVVNDLISFICNRVAITEGGYSEKVDCVSFIALGKPFHWVKPTEIMTRIFFSAGVSEWELGCCANSPE